MKTITIGFKISGAVGVLVGLMMCYIGWQHNPQCEFYCDGFVDWRSLLLLWAKWFVVVGVIGGVFISSILYVIKLALSVKNSKQDQ